MQIHEAFHILHLSPHQDLNHKLESRRLLGEISTTSNTDNITLIVGSEEELKSLLMRVKEESDKADLKLNSEKTNIMVYSHISSWQKGGETMETVSDFIFWASKLLQTVTAATKLKDTCSLEEKLLQI